MASRVKDVRLAIHDREKPKGVTFTAEPQLYRALFELARSLGHRSIASCVRNTLWLKVRELGLTEQNGRPFAPRRPIESYRTVRYPARQENITSNILDDAPTGL